MGTQKFTVISPWDPRRKQEENERRRRLGAARSRVLMASMLASLSGTGSTGGSEVFNPVTLFASGEQGGWWDPSDLSTMSQNSDGTGAATVGQPVGRILDKSGRGNHLIQATTASKPILRQSGALYWLEFDGVDDVLQVTCGAAFANIMAFAGHRYIAGVDALSITTGTANATAFMQRNNSLILSSGNAAQVSFATPAPPITMVIGCHSDSANNAGVLYVDNTNGGTQATGGSSMGDFRKITVGANENGAANFAQIDFHGAIVCGRRGSGTEIAQIRTFLATKQGRTL